MFASLPVHTSHKSMHYAGIGSRRTPQIVRETMTRLASRLSDMDYTLNSGGAQGADSAFEKGAQISDIFLASDATDNTRTIAKEIHPAPHKLRGYALDLMARNTFQIFGKDLNTPVDFVICYTPDGCESHNERTIATGGTGQAISMASLKNIPVINLCKIGWQNRLMAVLDIAI